MTAITICSDFSAHQNKVWHCFHCFPIYFPWSDGTGLDCKEIQPAHPKRDQSWVFIGRTEVEVEIPILWPPDAKSCPIWKTLMLGKFEGRRRRGRQRMRWLDGINGHGLGWTPGGGDGQGGLACWFSWVAKSQTWLSDWTELRGHEFLKRQYSTKYIIINKKYFNVSLF